MKTSYTPVPPVYYEIFSSEQDKEYSKVFYFSIGTEVEEMRGIIRGIINNGSNGEYLIFDSGAEVRIDRIITVNGIPGPAYDEYDSYALACLECKYPFD